MVVWSSLLGVTESPKWNAVMASQLLGDSSGFACPVLIQHIRHLNVPLLTTLRPVRHRKPSSHWRTWYRILSWFRLSSWIPQQWKNNVGLNQIRHWHVLLHDPLFRLEFFQNASNQSIQMIGWFGYFGRERAIRHRYEYKYKLRVKPTLNKGHF